MHRQQEIVTNDTATVLEIGLEPWGMYLAVPAGKQFVVIGEGPTPGKLEIIREPGRIVFYPWPNATLKVFCDGQLLHEEGP